MKFKWLDDFVEASNGILAFAAAFPALWAFTVKVLTIPSSNFSPEHIWSYGVVLLLFGIGYGAGKWAEDVRYAARKKLKEKVEDNVK
jgi:uncharacterized membrane protein YidH (DUF202 family)